MKLNSIKQLIKIIIHRYAKEETIHGLKTFSFF